MRRIIPVMTRTAAVLLSLVLSTTVLAATADLKLTIDVPPTAQVGETVTATWTVENLGPDTVEASVRIRIIPGLQCDGSIPLGTLAPGQKKSVSCSQEDLNYGLYYLHTTGYADGSAPEPSPQHAQNNFDEAFTDRITGPDLRVFLWSPQPAAKPGLPVRINVVYEIIARTPAENTFLTFTSPTRFVNLPSFCVAEENRAICSLGTIAPPSGPDVYLAKSLELDVVAPDESHVPFVVTAQITPENGEETPANNRAEATLHTYRTFFVREATDAALRNALSAAGAECDHDPCLVAFRIPTATERWHTIRLTSPLEPVRGLNLEIDGTTQSAYFGDTHAGPEIELDGSALETGDGLRIPSRCGITVRGLTINGFPQNGIALSDDGGCATEKTTRIEQNYIGTDPTGTRAVPNERGLFSTSEHPWTATGNVISGNARSAVYVTRGAGLITRNVIGLNPTHDAPLPNGASGIYLGPDVVGTDINDNYIGFNQHFGVAIDRAAQMVALRGNSFQANGGLAIDWGLDGPESGSPVPAPHIVSAVYADGVTTIQVDADWAKGATFPFVSLYASDTSEENGYAEGQYFLGEARPRQRFVFAGDLRGKWISATLTRVLYLGWLRSDGKTYDLQTTTSEMSRAVRVE